METDSKRDNKEQDNKDDTLFDKTINAAGKIENERNLEKRMEQKIRNNNNNENAYYLWFKDSNSTDQETKNMSYEYELVYQAQKESEYKSNLKIYVATFFLVFAGLLALLIFSPIIYKFFF